MTTLPAIYTILTSDAPQHTGRLREILQNLETEHRIRGFTVLGVDDNLSSITENIGEEDLILIVLTRQLEALKKKIENKFKALKTRQSGTRVAEILVDNVVYDNEFITFPTDLRPIRNREDMDDAWSSIEKSMKDMFPAKEKEWSEPAPPKDWFNYLKIGKGIGKIVITFIVLVFAMFGVLMMIIFAFFVDTVENLLLPLFIITFLISWVVAYYLTKRINKN